MDIKIADCGFSVTVDEMKQISSWVGGNFHKDKKQFCLFLYLTNKTVLSCYNKIIKTFEPELITRIDPKDKTPTKEELSNIVEF